MHDQSTIAFGAFAHRTIGQGLHACDLKLHSERTIEGQRSGSEIHMPFTMGQSPMSYDVAAMFSRRSSNNVAKLWTIVDGSVATCFDMYSTNLRRSYLVLESSHSQGGRSPAQQTRQTNVCLTTVHEAKKGCGVFLVTTVNGFRMLYEIISLHRLLHLTSVIVCILALPP